MNDTEFKHSMDCLEECTPIQDAAEAYPDAQIVFENEFDISNTCFRLHVLKETDSERNEHDHKVQLIRDGANHGVRLLDCKEQIMAAIFWIPKEVAEQVYEKTREILYSHTN